MNEKDQTTNQQDAAFVDWDKLMQDYWKTWSEPWDGWQNIWPQDQGKGQGRVAESFSTSMKMWQTMLGNMATPGAAENLQKLMAITPEIALGFAQTCLQGFVRVQEKAGDWMVKRNAALSSTDMQDLDRELIKSLHETYEKEFSRYLKLPQVGLGRLYQEKALEAVDKMNRLQLAMSDFLHMLYLPIEKSLNSLQQEMAKMAEAGPLDEKTKTYYNLWIKLLEGHYMELFKQQEYAETMSSALVALNDFVDARQAVINDSLQQLNIPNNHDLDELSKEIYLLKKRVRALEKKQ
jgi:hypothetical protein